MRRILVDELHKDWMKDPKYRREYQALEEEFIAAATTLLHPNSNCDNL
jgi:hypothetical protein